MQHVAGGTHAWVPPRGGWGHSNTGLIVGEGASLLVDTLFDRPRTEAMLGQMAPHHEGAPITVAVNTHGNGDHWFGNGVLHADVEIVASAASVLDMEAVGPATVASLPGIPGPIGAFTASCFGDFAIAELVEDPPRLPGTTFTGSRELSVGGVEVLLLDLGPAHTRGDTVVVCPRDGVVLAGDLVFAEGTPIMWEGPVERWIEACTRLRALGADHGITQVVPGHGPVLPLARVGEMADYLSFVAEEAGERHARGLTVEEAARDIDLGPFAHLPESERLAANVLAIYRQLEGGPAPTGPEMFGCMAQWARATAGAEEGE
ncbi:hypothetical protein GCM10022215_36750 [Nocardioides fonticola]|uniref:Metallo-beta-lactamase domain-containing protein n=1 Tax=Nocardioides fonticola TaxID=450363 RepID=A0ABP7XVQ5_9ACTN